MGLLMWKNVPQREEKVHSQTFSLLYMLRAKYTAEERESFFSFPSEFLIVKYLILRLLG